MQPHTPKLSCHTTTPLTLISLVHTSTLCIRSLENIYSLIDIKDYSKAISELAFSFYFFWPYYNYECLKLFAPASVGFALFVSHSYLKVFPSPECVQMFPTSQTLCVQLKRSAVRPSQVSPWHLCSQPRSRFHTLFLPTLCTTCNICSPLTRVTTVSKAEWATKYHAPFSSENI